ARHSATAEYTATAAVFHMMRRARSIHERSIRTHAKGAAHGTLEDDAHRVLELFRRAQARVAQRRFRACEAAAVAGHRRDARGRVRIDAADGREARHRYRALIVRHAGRPALTMAIG